jgi:hypothetical protein
MAVQLGIGIGGITCAYLAHTYYVRELRKRRPTGRLLQFAPGSADDALAETLRTGDLILFSRDCVRYEAAAALACSARKLGSAHGFDQVGLVLVSRHGEPHVAEMGWDGPHVRKYAARIRCSAADAIVVRPLAAPLDAAAETRLWAAVEQRMAQPAPACIPVRDAVRTLAWPGSNISLDFIADVYRDADIAGQSPLSMSRLEIDLRARHGARSKPDEVFGPPVIVRANI